MTGYIWPPNQHIPSTWAVSHPRQSGKAVFLRRIEASRVTAEYLGLDFDELMEQAQHMSSTTGMYMPHAVETLLKVVSDQPSTSWDYYELNEPLPHHTVSLTRINHHWKEKP